MAKITASHTEAETPNVRDNNVSPQLAALYAISSVIILLATTEVWSLLSARLQHSNADQLVSPYLFQHANVLKGALLPGQHSFLFKWPLFLLIRLFGYSAGSFAFFTAASSVVTVAFLAAVIYRIESRPLVFGTLCLALASMLLLVPAQPYPGSLLPVNMAMLTTRNLEYIVYVASLVLLVRAIRIRSLYFVGSAGLLSILIASDKLFLSISLGGALLALIVYALARRWRLVSTAVQWLVASIAASLISLGILWLINASGLTHIAAQATAGPYGLVQGARSFGLAIVYAGFGLLTNFGANPAFAATTIKSIPQELTKHLLSLGGASYVVNLILLVGLVLMVYRLVIISFTVPNTGSESLDKSSILSLMLLWTGLATVAVFILSNHYYAVDARYLTIVVFAVFVSAATYGRRFSWQPHELVWAGCIIALSIVLGLAAAISNYHDDANALSSSNQRNDLVAQVLSRHPVDILVGDYWRVIPTKAASNNLTVLPLASCTQPRDVLSSSIWQPSLKNHSFAYMLTLDGSLTDYKHCTLQTVTKSFGRPNASVLIAGTLNQPKEFLLFYDHGINNSPPKLPQPAAGPATVVPISLEELPYTTCSTVTIMNIVAHQDDDLLFMSPDLAGSIGANYCLRTIYMTAGDDGIGAFYWLSRERGSEAAYASMLGIPNSVWVERIVKLPNGQFISIANPRGNTKISLIFMHLPDGNLRGEGFSNSHFESLARLEAGSIKSIHTVDGQSSYSSGQVSTALTNLMQAYKPGEIRTQSSYIGKQYPDHSDHMAVGWFAKTAYQHYEHDQYNNLVTIPLKYYVGYPVHERPANVSGTSLSQKQATFLEYSRFDDSVCHSLQECMQTPTYDSYLKRQYQNSY